MLKGQSSDQAHLYDQLDFSWDIIVQSINAAMRDVEELSSDLREERSNFILEETYREMLGSLSNRIALFDKLRSTAAPRSREDIQALEAIHREWKRLLAELTRTTEELSRYLKKEQPLNQ